MLTPWPSRHWITLLSHRAHVTREGCPRESRTKSLEYFAYDIACRMFSSHQGAPMSPASAPALQSDNRPEMLRCLRKSMINANTIGGTATDTKEAFDQSPRPIANPKAIHVTVRSDGSLQWTNRKYSIAAVARYNGASVLKKMLAVMTAGDNANTRAANAPAIWSPTRLAARYVKHVLRQKHAREESLATVV